MDQKLQQIATKSAKMCQNVSQRCSTCFTLGRLCNSGQIAVVPKSATTCVKRSLYTLIGAPTPFTPSQKVQKSTFWRAKAGRGPNPTEPLQKRARVAKRHELHPRPMTTSADVDLWSKKGVTRPKSVTKCTKVCQKVSKAGQDIFGQTAAFCPNALKNATFSATFVQNECNNWTNDFNTLGRLCNSRLLAPLFAPN